MGNFQKYWSQNVGQDFIVLDFFHGQKILKVDGMDGRDPQNREKNAPARRFTCMLRTTFPYILFDWYPFLVVLHLNWTFNEQGTRLNGLMNRKPV
jgi:hypothetical protein